MQPAPLTGLLLIHRIEETCVLVCTAASVKPLVFFLREITVNAISLTKSHRVATHHPLPSGDLWCYFSIGFDFLPFEKNITRQIHCTRHKCETLVGPFSLEERPTTVCTPDVDLSCEELGVLQEHLEGWDGRMGGTMEEWTIGMKNGLLVKVDGWPIERMGWWIDRLKRE